MIKETPLQLAAQNGHLCVVECLYNQGCELSVNDVDNSTPLHYAATNGHLSVVEYLVNHKSDINAVNNNLLFF